MNLSKPNYAYILSVSFLILELYAHGQEKEINIPNMIEIEGILIDKTEVSNIAWLEYIYFNESKVVIVYNSHNNDNLLRCKNPSYRFEPITNISYEEAVSYCKWRSEIVSKKLGIKVRFRLPTIEEWDKIAKHILDEKKKKILKNQDRLRKKMKNRKDEIYLQQREPPINKIYNFFSNVSEMTTTKGISKGISNGNILSEKDNFKNFIYNEPNDYLGFRCIGEIIDE